MEFEVTKHNRRTTPKGFLEKETGKKIDRPLMPSKHKVQIMEYLLTLPYNKIQEYVKDDFPAFVVLSAKMLLDGNLALYIATIKECASTQGE